MKHIKYYLIVGVVGFYISCSQPPNYPDEPQLQYIGINKKSVFQGGRTSPIDTLVVNFSFTDGDGDLGNDLKDTTVQKNIFLYDSRDTTLTPFKIPPVPAQGSGNGISGEVTIYVPNNSKTIVIGNDTIGLGNICCIFPDGRTCFTDPRFPRDTFSFLIQMIDRAGHKSNMIRTETITILCQ